MPQPPVAAEIHQPLDIHCDFAPQITFDHIVTIDHFPDLQHLLVGELGHPAGLRHIYFLHDFMSLSWPNPMDILQCNNNALVGRNIHPCDAGHDHTPACRPFRSG